MNSVSNSWKKLGINQMVIDGCINETNNYVDGSDGYNYWMRCVDFLKQIENIPYEMLSRKQRNWVFNIKTDLMAKGYSFNEKVGC